ncbi:hypothetical protein BU23DRAFT_238757 [Bimuria novae-zelandiae CBS 107.79]|uniref:Uncharacterized protein n=1 Tax=Bimuria novae-zelandiae CBS 107.79 TaxID=1447943 RepID=A0A6A5UWM0_9PLEO|nr:hypothetical protein BU23DRAFT_238757 [Bimuria novae-zelandiae CBS 107.79]
MVLSWRHSASYICMLYTHVKAWRRKALCCTRLYNPRTKSSLYLVLCSTAMVYIASITLAPTWRRLLSMRLLPTWVYFSPSQCRQSLTAQYQQPRAKHPLPQGYYIVQPHPPSYARS